ncbi:MAG TPA: hypothetical protein VK043_00775, partial [Burkholderiales bacterium]|nr:hypothetical protein [Burkholderiales bacterium]
ASAQAVQPEPSFKDYVDLTAEDLAPRPGAVSSAEILKHFPKGSFADGMAAAAPKNTVVAREVPAANARPAAEILAEFPQPSFDDNARPGWDTRSSQVAGSIENRAY